MKTILLSLMIIITSISFKAYCETEIPLNVEATPSDIPITEKPSKGHRMPPARIICSIDFEQGSISGSSALLDDVSIYQAWDEEGEVCLIDARNDHELIETLQTLGSGCYMLKLIGDGYCLTGYIEL